MADESLYERALERIGAAGPAAKTAPVRDSAAVVPWRRRADGEVEVYWVRRSPELAFMGGWHAFPGGGVARSDAGVRLAGEPSGLDAGPADAALPEKFTGGLTSLGPLAPPGLTATLCRELFEETGLLPPPAGGWRPEDVERLERARSDLEGGARFAEVLAGLGAEPDLSALVYAGRWLTPPLGPVRFDNRFFLLEWPRVSALEPRVDGEEIVEGEWIRPAAALERWQRGEVIGAPPILHLLRVLAEDGPRRGLARMREPFEANLGPHRRIEFRPGVLLFPLVTPTLPPARHTNAYVLGFGDAVLVDPGSPYDEEIDGLRRALEALAAEGRRVRAIWLTHHHPDHSGGVAALRRDLGVPVAAHAAAARRLAERGIEVDEELEDGQRVELAGEPPFAVRVIHTPGHARGHLCFLCEPGGSVVAGDLVAGFGTVFIDPPEGDMDQYLGSLGRIESLAPSTLFPGHGPVVLDAAGKLREYVEHRLWREERVLAAWRRGLKEPAAMLPEVYDDVPRQAWPLAERQILAHLERLVRTGRVERPG